MKTVEDVLKLFSNEKIDDIEYYRNVNDKFFKWFHGDFMESVDEEDVKPNDLVYTWGIMEEEEYEHSILANSGIYADFEDWYGNANAKVLIIVLSHNQEE